MNFRRLAYLFFFISGFCSLVYQLIWTRLAMAAFGVNSQVISIALSAFMLGLGLGSYAVGLLYERKARGRGTALAWYAACEILIGIGGLVVPLLFSGGRSLLLGTGTTSSAAYLALSGVTLFLALVPWCTLMGATVPLMLQVLKEQGQAPTGNNFSLLYGANVLGALFGTFLSAFLLVEIVGFLRALVITALLNFLVGLLAFAALSRAGAGALTPERQQPETSDRLFPASHRDRLTLLALFATGFVSLGMEVAWVRLFTPYVRTEVYAFAGMLTSYLLATFSGTLTYRIQLRRGTPHAKPRLLWSTLIVAGAVPLLLADPRAFFVSPWERVILGILPICFVLGYLTPLLVDRYSEGEPVAAGRAYAWNVLGCVLGPLVSGFVLLPAFGTKVTVTVLDMLLAVAAGIVLLFGRQRLRRSEEAVAWSLAVAVALVMSSRAISYDQIFSRREVRNDYAATVIAVGEGMKQRLLVNGVGMTSKNHTNKLMAHLPLMHLDQKPARGLVICFGMGTTFRSALSWDFDVTAVDLIPSVPALFSYFFSDAESVLSKPNAHVVVDDGRRFLDRADVKYDVIIVDPPPPVEAAGSSLLYSSGFYDSAKAKLAPSGILQQWVPGSAPPATQLAVANTVQKSFPHVRAFGDLSENRGLLLLASMKPIPSLSPVELIKRMPESAIADLQEWRGDDSALSLLVDRMAYEVDLRKLLAPPFPDVLITDDRPYNEYYLLRSWL